MAPKRKSTNISEAGSAPIKRPRQARRDINGDEEGSSRSVFSATSSKIDPDSGQRGAFPGLDANIDDEQLFYGPASDGMEYLRMVRTEAKSVPRLMIAPSASTSSKTEHPNLDRLYNGGGWYEDGAYMADADEEVADASDQKGAQEAYYEALVLRFLKVRRMLSISPPPTEFSATPTTFSHADGLRPDARRPQWKYCFCNTQPRARSIVAASQEDIIRAISRIEILFNKRNLLDDVAGPNLSAWLWSLLAQCREVKLMDSEQISVLRDLVKTALAVGGKIRRGIKEIEADPSSEADLEDVAEDGDDGDITDAEGADDEMQPFTDKRSDLEETANETRSDELEKGPDAIPVDSEEGEVTDHESDTLQAAKQILLERLAKDDEDNVPDSHEPESKRQEDLTPENSKQRAFATVDIVVTLVGEVFGQRDLLSRRELW